MQTGMRTGLLVAMMVVLALPAAGDDPLAGLPGEDSIGQAPLSGRRSDEDDALAALEQGKGLTVEAVRSPRRDSDVQVIGSGVMLSFGANQAPPPSAPPPSPPPPAPPPAHTGGLFGSLFSAFNFGN